MKKIAVIGCGGAGKSTLARKLSELLDIPVYHLDQLFWKPGWISTEEDDWNHLVRNLVCEKEWIIDGNYGSTLDLRLNDSDTIIFLNMPTFLCVYRVIKRRFQYHGRTRPDMAEGCPEKLDLEFLKWILEFNRIQKQSIVARLNKLPAEKNIVILNSPREVAGFIANLKNTTTSNRLISSQE